MSEETPMKICMFRLTRQGTTLGGTPERDSEIDVGVTRRSIRNCGWTSGTETDKEDGSDLIKSP